MELFKTTGILDEPILREVAKWGIPKLENRAAIICFIVSLVLSAARYPALAAVFFSVGLFFVLWQYVLFRWITVKRNLRDMQDFNGVMGYQYTSWFDEEGLAVINQTNHGEGKFKYAFLKRAFETEHILALQTKRNQFVPSFKNELSLEELDELMVFLKSRNKKIKICRLKKQNDKGASGN